MKRPIKGIALTAVLAALTAAVMTGCSGDGNVGSSSHASSAAPNTTSQDAPVSMPEAPSIPPVESVLPSMPEISSPLSSTK